MKHGLKLILQYRPKFKFKFEENLNLNLYLKKLYFTMFHNRHPTLNSEFQNYAFYTEFVTDLGMLRNK